MIISLYGYTINLINNEFTHRILKQNSKEAQEFIEKYEIIGFPVQIVKIEKHSPFIRLGFLDGKEELDFLNKFIDERNEKINFQELTAFEKYVFKKSGIGYNVKTNKIIGPQKNENYEGCIKKEKPSHYQCLGIRGIGVIVNPDKKTGSFKTTVFDYNDEGLSEDSAVATTSFVENKKVALHSYCYYGGKYIPNKSDRKEYLLISPLECYTVTTKICNVINKLNTIEDYRNIRIFNEFVSILKSKEYKEKQLASYRESYRNIFLYSNEEFSFNYYSKISDGFYNIEKQGKDPLTSIIEFENKLAIKEITNFAEFYKKEKLISTKAFINPCKGLIKSGIMANE